MIHLEKIIKVNNRLLNWFDENWQPLTERELLLPDGSILRPDRVIIQDKKAQVIDYKTGEPREKDNKQVLQYKEVLQKMEYNVTGCWLVYTGKDIIVDAEAPDESAWKQGTLQL